MWGRIEDLWMYHYQVEWFEFILRQIYLEFDKIIMFTANLYLSQTVCRQTNRTEDSLFFQECSANMILSGKTKPRAMTKATLNVMTTEQRRQEENCLQQDLVFFVDFFSKFRLSYIDSVSGSSIL